MRVGAVAFAALLLPWAVVAEGEEAASSGDDKDELTKPYVAPNVDEVHWAETFDGDVFTRWSHSSKEKYNGKFGVEKRKTEALVGDVGLLVPEAAKHYGISTKFPAFESQKDVPFVVQFEVAFQDGLSCGGSYLKIFDSEGKDNAEFDNDTPYVIMFGPDRCGATDKVHFIFRHKNPKTGVYEEKHSKETAQAPRDQRTHLYGLVINPDNSYEVLIDGEMKVQGNLLTSMEPPVNPPKEIDDPEDSKPTDWIDEAKIDDPASSKPEDWDEEAPAMIPDPAKLTAPAGWVEDAAKRIDDPTAKQPDDWDNEEDGEWEAPVIDNPACSVGCGKYEPPMISNPEYKGKWHAPKVDNPEYVGVWKAKQIANPDYFYDETPYLLPKMDAVGIDIWTMSGGMIFDNIVFAKDATKAQLFAEQTFQVRKTLEELQMPKPSKSMSAQAMSMIAENPIPVVVVISIVLLATLWCCCLRGEDVPPAPSREQRAKKSDKKDDDADKKDDAADKKDEKDSAAASSKDGDAKLTKRNKKTEGGVGDLDGEES